MTDAGQLAGVRDALRRGGLALLPTDTVYGLAAALDSTEGVAALYRLKGRPRSQPCQVLLYAPELLEEALAPLDTGTVAAVRTLLPGAVTCLVPDPPGRYAPAAGDASGSVGLRVPRLDMPLAIDIPLAATSANDPGGDDPASLAEVPAAMRAAVAVVVDRGPLTRRSSTIVDLRGLASGRPALLIRRGRDADLVASRLAGLGVAIAGEATPG